MAGRASVFRDPRVRGLLKEHFTIAADENWRLQNGNGPECRLFQDIAVLGHYKGKGGTKQGYYAITPGGKLLASANSRDPDRIGTMLDAALQKWAALKPEERAAAPQQPFAPKHRWEQSYPEGGLVLERFVRDVGGGDRRWNRDFVWLAKHEARWLVPDKPGRKITAPNEFARRLARFHLVDNVRGQTLPFAQSEIRDLKVHIVYVRTDGDFARLLIYGTTVAKAKGPWLLGKCDWTPDRPWPRTMKTSLLGTASYDLTNNRFVEFELGATGQRTGRTGNDGRGQDPKPGTVAFYFTLVSRDIRVPPTFLEFYEADWVVRPSGAGYGTRE